MSSSSSTPSYSSLQSDSSDFETDDSSDLDDLYQSFDFEEEAALDVPAGDGSGSRPAPLAAISQLPLYLASQITALQSYLLIFQFAIRHSMTTKSFTELLQLLSVHLPVTATIPKSVHKLKRVFMECFPDSHAISHFYCDCCHRPLSSASSSCLGYGCSGEGHPAVISTVPLGPQLKRRMGGV